MKDILHVAVPWYETAEDYSGVLAMLPAVERQDPFSHDVFTARMKNNEQTIKGQGSVPVRIPVKAVAIKAWCDAHNDTVCRRTIVAYVMEELAKKIASGLNTN